MKRKREKNTSKWKLIFRVNFIFCLTKCDSIFVFSIHLLRTKTFRYVFCVGVKFVWFTVFFIVCISLGFECSICSTFTEFTFSFRLLYLFSSLKIIYFFLILIFFFCESILRSYLLSRSIIMNWIYNFYFFFSGRIQTEKKSI